MILDNYLKMLNEGTPKDKIPSRVPDNKILFHGSRTQNLKTIEPKKWKDALLKEHKSAIWASWDPTFATMFCINWRKNVDKIFLGIDYSYYESLPYEDERQCWEYSKKGSSEFDFDVTKKKHCEEMNKNPSWLVVVPTRYKKLILKPCSLYQIKGSDWIIQRRVSGYPWQWPEAYSKKPARVIKEIKYSTVLEAYNRNGVKILVEDELKPDKKKKLERMFSYLKI